MLKKSKILWLLVLTMVISCCFIISACGNATNKPVITQSSTRYDLSEGGDYVVTADLKGGSIVNLKIGSQIIDRTEYLFDEESEELTILEIYMRFLDPGDYTFTLTTDKGSAEFEVEVYNSVETSFDTATKNYTYGSLSDVKFDADLTGVSITALKIGNRTVASANYSYADGKFTLEGDYCDTLYGTTAFTLLLSNNQSYNFSVVSDCLFNLNFNDEYVPQEWYNVINPSVVDGWDGKALNYVAYGQGGNFLMFSNNGAFGIDVGIEEGEIYRLSFDFKNNWDSSEGESWGTIGFNVHYTEALQYQVFNFNYNSEEILGGFYTYDEENDVYSITMYFDAPVNKGFTNAYAGYYPSEPTKKLCDFLIDNIVLVKAGNITPTMPEQERTKTHPSGSENDLWFTGQFGAAKVESVSIKNGAALAADSYKIFASTIVLKGSYLKALTHPTTFVALLDDDSEIEFTVNIGLANPTSFTDDKARDFEYGSANDIVFEADFGNFSIKELRLGDIIIPQSCYEATSTSFTLKNSYLNTLAGTNQFTIVVDNAGMVEGKTDDETHTFTITSNAQYREDFEKAGYNTGFVGTAGSISEVSDGISGKSARITSTGGNFMTFGPSTAAWSFGHTVVPMIDNELYTIEFDIKDFGTTDEQVEFYLHGNVDASFKITDGLATILSPNNVLVIENVSEDVSRIIFTFKYNASNYNNFGVIALEASGYNEYYYDILIDNIVIYKVNLGTSKTYAYDSLQDVEFNVEFASAKSVTANGEALDANNYSIESGKFIINADYCQSIYGTVNIVVTLDDDSTVPFILKSTRLYYNDFNGDAPDTDSFFAYTPVPSLVDSWIDDGGKAVKIAGNGGEVLVFGNGWAHNYCPVGFEVGKTYKMSFDMKMDGTDNPQWKTFGMAAHMGPGQVLNLNFNDGSYDNNNSSATVNAVWDADNTAFHVEITFTVANEGVTDGWPGYVDGATDIVYSWIFDNIAIFEVIA